MYFEIEKRLILIDPNKIFLMKPSYFEIFDSVENYDKNTTVNKRNFNDADQS